MIEISKEQEREYICDLHIKYNTEITMSPCRGRLCIICNKKKVDGYSNPDHICNPFGYLYLFPKICVKCSIQYKKCMWCNKN